MRCPEAARFETCRGRFVDEGGFRWLIPRQGTSEYMLCELREKGIIVDTESSRSTEKSSLRKCSFGRFSDKSRRMTVGHCGKCCKG